MSLFDVEPPRWLEAQSARYAERPGQWGSLLGTALAGGLRALTERDPVLDAEGNPVLDKNGQPQTKARPFWDTYQEARMSQADPMWPLKAKAMEANIENAKTLTMARWMNYDRLAQQAQWTQDSLQSLQGYDGSTPVPEGIKDTRVLAAANKMRNDYVTGQLKTQKLENDLTIAKNKLDLQSEALGIRQAQVDLNERTLAVKEEQFDRRLAQDAENISARERIAALQAQNRIDVEKLRGLSRLDAMSRPLSKLQFINRHLNTVFKDLQSNNPTPEKPITVMDAQRVLSDAYDALPQDISAGTNPATGKKVPKVISVTPAP